MKIVINDCYGGFTIPEEICLKKGILPYDEMDRSDPDLVAFVEEKGGSYRVNNYSRLVVIDIPDDATDWMIVDNDGSEWVVYVIDGRLRSSLWKECD